MSDFTIETLIGRIPRPSGSKLWPVLIFLVAALGLPFLAQPDGAARKQPDVIWRGNSASLDAIHFESTLKRPRRETPVEGQQADLPQ